MRDLVVSEALEAMARDAARRLRELVAAGQEIPYEVREPGDGSPLCRYLPLTERFVRDHAGELRELDAFGTACATLEASALATPYLEEMGIAPPPEPRRRAELAAIAFLCRLWTGSTDFSLDRERLAAALVEVQAGGEAGEGEIEVVVPLRGFAMPVARLDLGEVTIVSAEAVEVPPEAGAGDGAGASPWEPAFLAVARVAEPDPEIDAEASDAGIAAVESFRRLITTLRLFKAGGVALGPHAWTRIAGDRWRRIATGAGRPRSGGYRLAETELADLAALAGALGERPAPLRPESRRPGLPPALGRAVSRFEAGLERPVAVEALSDHLLALRSLLEGGGPADLGLPMRVAALCAEPERRDAVKATVERAVALERELWSGEPAPGGGAVPAETAAQLEELARAILVDACCGHLGSDLRSTSDEILLADGLAVGEGSAAQRGSTAEWEIEATQAAEDPDPEWAAVEEDSPEGEPVMPVPSADQVRVVKVNAGEARITPQPPHPTDEEETVFARARASTQPSADRAPTGVLEAVPAERPAASAREPRELEPRSFDEVAEHSPVLRLIAQTRAEHRATRERVRDLFPRPETCEWNVRELAYDRRRRAEVGVEAS